MNEIEAILFKGQSHPSWGNDPVAQDIQRLRHGYALIENLNASLGSEANISGDLAGSILGRPTWTTDRLTNYSEDQLRKNPAYITKSKEKQKQLYELLKLKAGAQGKQVNFSKIDLTYADPKEIGGGKPSTLNQKVKSEFGEKPFLVKQYAKEIRTKINEAYYQAARISLLDKTTDPSAGVSWNPWTYDTSAKAKEKSMTALKDAKMVMFNDNDFTPDEKRQFTDEINVAIEADKTGYQDFFKAISNLPVKAVETLGNNPKFPSKLEELQAREEEAAYKKEMAEARAIIAKDKEENKQAEESAPTQSGQATPPPAVASKAAPTPAASGQKKGGTRLENTDYPEWNEDNIKEVQTILKNAGLSVKVDGIYGTETRDAIKEYTDNGGHIVVNNVSVANSNPKSQKYAATPTAQVGGANQNGGNGGGSSTGNTVGGKPISTNTGGQAGQGQPSNPQAGGGTGTGTGTNQPAPDKVKMSEAFQKVMDSMEKGDLKSQLLTGAGLIQDMVGLFSGLEGMNEDMTEYKPSQYLVDMVAHSKRLVEQGLPETEEEYMRGEAKRSLDLHMGVIKANAGGSGGAVLGNAFAASRDYYEAISKIDQADINAKMAAIPYHLTALEKMEQAHLQKYLDRRDMEIARTNAASKLVSSSLENSHKAIQYEQAFGKGSVNQVLAWSNLQKLYNEEKIMEDGSEKLADTILGGSVGIDPNGKANVPSSSLVSGTGLPSNTATTPVKPPVNTYATQNQSGGQY